MKPSNVETHHIPCIQGNGIIEDIHPKQSSETRQKPVKVFLRGVQTSIFFLASFFWAHADDPSYRSVCTAPSLLLFLELLCIHWRLM